jgi:integrase/recombinase XerD
MTRGGLAVAGFAPPQGAVSQNGRKAKRGGSSARPRSTPPRGRILPCYLTPAEAHGVIDAGATPRDRRFLELLWRTGGRVTEALGIRVGDVTPTGIRMRNLKQGEWSGGEWRPIAAEKFVYCDRAYLAGLLAELAGLPPSALVTSGAGGRALTRRRAEQIVDAAARIAGVYKVRRVGGTERPASPHLFRHGAAVNLLRQGVPITAVQAHLGHTSLRSTQRYTQLADAELERLIGRASF